jgi:hypothetical protein
MEGNKFFVGLIIGLIISSLVAVIQHSVEAGIFIMMFVISLLLIKAIDILMEIENKHS